MRAYMGIGIVITIHIVTQGLLVGIVGAIWGLLYGIMYLLLKKNVRHAYPMILLMFML